MNPKSFLHSELCQRGRQDGAIWRHNAIRDLTAVRLKNGTATTTIIEPAALNKQQLKRADLAVCGIGAKDGIKTVIDFSIVSVISKKALLIADQVKRFPGQTAFGWTIRQIERILKIKSHQKAVKYQGLYDGEFLPAIITTGGSASKDLIKYITTTPKGEGGKQNISIVLANGRARQCSN